MGTVIGDLLPLGIGVAVSPVPIIAAILMLLSKRARSTSVGFALGWLAGIVVATAVFVALAGVIDNSDDGPSTTSSVIRLVLGVLLLALGLKQWRGRNVDHGVPKWMTAIDELTATKSFGLAFALAAVNPKNLLMCVAAGVTIGGAALSLGQQIAAVAIFTVIAACTVAIPVIGYLVAAKRLRQPLDELKGWLQTNNTAVMSVLFLVIGVVLLGKGIGGL